jgi:hypothetical protein
LLLYNQKEVQMRRFKKDGCHLRQQTCSSISCLADLTKQLYKQFPKRTVICASSLQVFLVILQVAFTS